MGAKCFARPGSRPPQKRLTGPIAGSDLRRHRVPMQDVRALLRLCSELHTSGSSNGANDAAAGPSAHGAKMRLLHGVCRLTDTDRATASVASLADGEAGATI